VWYAYVKRTMKNHLKFIAALLHYNVILFMLITNACGVNLYHLTVGRLTLLALPV